jgi:hypothetical protein
MNFTSLLIGAGIDPANVNLLRHCPGGVLDPFAAWRSNRTAFEAYQTIQKPSQRSYFSRPIWASFAPDRQGRTFFVGVFDAQLRGTLEADTIDPLTHRTEHAGTVDVYDCTARAELSEYVGRLVIDWGTGTRAWGQKATTQKPILELLRDVEEPKFPGYLELIEPLSAIPTLPARWVDFLREGKGIYLLTCPRTKEQYVGKADGADGFWGRWLNYATTGDGGNVRLRSRERSDYQVSILEVAGSAASPDDILRMEIRWKAKLQTREMGLNGN